MQQNHCFLPRNPELKTKKPVSWKIDFVFDL